MARKFYNLPSLTALGAFEASARHRDLKLAAAELNVTPGAVSRQIKSLEDELEVVLFSRSPEGLVPTAEAEELFAVVSRGFQRTSDAIQLLKSGNGQKQVTLACSSAMASMWLMRRMGDFWRKYPEIQVDHLISDQAREYRRAEVDLRLRYGNGAWPDENAVLMFPDRLYPVCSPEFAKNHKDAGLQDLPHLSLLHVDWLDPEWTDWDEFLRRTGANHSSLSGRRFGSFSICIQAAMEHQGVALGWHEYLKPLIHEGKLVRITDTVIDAPGSYYLTWNSNRQLSAAAGILKEWLLEYAVENKKPENKG